MSNTYTSIEDEAEAGSESEGEPTLSKHLIKSEIITVLSSLLIVHYQSKVFEQSDL